jgi:hypothetical protein
MFYGMDENSIIKVFSTACFITMGVLFLFVIGFEITGENGLWLAYRSLHFAIYGIFALGLYKIIKLLSQLVGEMKFFRHHYILKDKKEKKNE